MPSPDIETGGCGICICGLFCITLIFLLFFLPGGALYALSKESKYHSVTYIKLLDSHNKTYKMGLQCLEKNIDEFKKSCAISDFSKTVIIACGKFSKSTYGSFEFKCTNETYIDARKNDQGGKYYERNMVKYIVSIIWFCIGGFFILCMILFVVFIFSAFIWFEISDCYRKNRNPKELGDDDDHQMEEL